MTSKKLKERCPRCFSPLLLKSVTDEDGGGNLFEDRWIECSCENDENCEYERGTSDE